MRWLTRARGRRLRAAAAAALLLGSGVALGVHWLGLDSLPDVSVVMDTGLPNDNLVFDRTGTVLLAELQQKGGLHSDLPLKAMGRWLPAATVAIDDPGFWNETGVDPAGILRAAWTDLRAGAIVQTGATITQRLVRLRVGSALNDNADRTRQAVLAARVAAAYPPARILEAYLNTLPYGSGATGAEAAAITYFQVDASQLDLAQASLLAGLPLSPSALDPLRNLRAAKERQRQVLDGMVRTGAITAEQADQAAAESLLLTGPAALNVAPAFVDQVAAELRLRFGADAVLRGGFSVVSTLDWGLQQQAAATMQPAIAASRPRGSLVNGTLVAMDPRTGQVLAMLGAGDPQGPGAQFSLATTPANPGNTMATFAYAAAIASRRYTMVTPVVDAPLTADLGPGGRYQVRNFDLRSHGTCELRACLGGGLNVPAVEVELAVGVPEVVRTARALGAPPSGPDRQELLPEQYGPSVALGGYAETALAMTTGYAALAAGGVRHDPETMLHVTAPDGRVVYRAQTGGGQQAVDSGTAFIVSEMLADDASRALIYGANGPLVLPGRHAAARVGTSENFHDGWTVGYTPSLAAAVWIGDLAPVDPRTGELPRTSLDGGLVAAPAWHRFMVAALDQLRKPDEWYRPPAGVTSAVVSGRPAWFLPGTSPETPAPALPAGVQLG
ncbi:MAG TPA: transglycosylase domain-containing protein [Candidatus Dormibacteraeota bacterium]